MSGGKGASQPTPRAQVRCNKALAQTTNALAQPSGSYNPERRLRMPRFLLGAWGRSRCANANPSVSAWASHLMPKARPDRSSPSSRQSVGTTRSASGTDSSTSHEEHSHLRMWLLPGELCHPDVVLWLLEHWYKLCTNHRQRYRASRLQLLVATVLHYPRLCVAWQNWPHTEGLSPNTRQFISCVWWSWTRGIFDNLFCPSVKLFRCREKHVLFQYARRRDQNGKKTKF